MKISVKTLVKLGAAVLVGAAVFVGSIASDRSEHSQVKPDGKDKKPERNPCKDSAIKAGEGFRAVQDTMLKTSQFINTMVSVCDAFGRLTSNEPVLTFNPPYGGYGYYGGYGNYIHPGSSVRVY